MASGGSSPFNWGYRGRRDRGRGRGGRGGGGPSGDPSRESAANNGTGTEGGITLKGRSEEIVGTLLTSVQGNRSIQVTYHYVDDMPPPPLLPTANKTRPDEEQSVPQPKKQKKDSETPTDSQVIDPAQKHKAAFYVNNCPNIEDWKSDEKSEGYVKLMEGTLPGLVALQRLYYQRPWHSKVRLPLEADNENGDEFYHFECHDLDCLIVVVRMLVGTLFEPEPEYATAALMTCANHDFGSDRRADYLAKGMLAQKLFPEELNDPNFIDDINALLPKMTFENLLKHPGVDKVLFASRYFILQSRQLLTMNPAVEFAIESIHEDSLADMTNVSQVNWDGIKTLSETVSEQAHYMCPAENGTSVYRRFCHVPSFIRVMFTPDKDHPRSFDDVQRFDLRAPAIKRDTGEFMAESTYVLRGIVKMDPKNPIENPAEVRTYDNNAVMMRPTQWSTNTTMHLTREKNWEDTKWIVGDPNLKFMLFYNVWEGEEYPTPLAPPQEYRSPVRVQPWHILIRPVPR
ncbi:hypothetical protein F4803DRAFT_217389 [Xylaria telfairii]|nr:hypothetical protein F4803DRAFT_217389 [Xylaria telfairii]